MTIFPCLFLSITLYLFNPPLFIIIQIIFIYVLFLFLENFLLSLSGDQQHLEDEIFYIDNKNGFTKAIDRLYSRDVCIVFFFYLKNT